MSYPFDLQRFVDAREPVYRRILDELRREQGVALDVVRLPQIAGLGFSAMAQQLAIGSRAEAAAYLEHNVLGPRLVECTRLVLAARAKSITDILRSPDDMKFRSRMTLFDAVSTQPVFKEAIEAFYADGRDPATLLMLKTA